MMIAIDGVRSVPLGSVSFCVGRCHKHDLGVAASQESADLPDQLNDCWLTCVRCGARRLVDRSCKAAVDSSGYELNVSAGLRRHETRGDSPDSGARDSTQHIPVFSYCVRVYLYLLLLQPQSNRSPTDRSYATPRCMAFSKSHTGRDVGVTGG